MSFVIFFWFFLFERKENIIKIEIKEGSRFAMIFVG